MTKTQTPPGPFHLLGLGAVLCVALMCLFRALGTDNHPTSPHQAVQQAAVIQPVLASGEQCDCDCRVPLEQLSLCCYSVCEGFNEATSGEHQVPPREGDGILKHPPMPDAGVDFEMAPEMDGGPADDPHQPLLNNCLRSCLDEPQQTMAFCCQFCGCHPNLPFSF